MMNHGEFCLLLENNGFNLYTGVPCSILSNIISYLSGSPEFTYIPATREDEAIGIAFGAYIGGKKPVVLMQNSGLGVSIDALTSLVLLYKVPMLFIISWRGYQGKDAPEHLLMGRCMLDFLRAMHIPAEILERDSVEKQVMNAVKIMDRKEVPVALVLREGVID